MEIIDLHTHSIYSDGTYTPYDIFKCAKEKGIKAVALTDHDTTGGLEEAEKAGIYFGVEAIPGIEFYAQYKHTELHILGYFIDRTCKRLEEFLCGIKENRHNRNIEMIKKLNDLGIVITLQELAQTAHDKIITRAHFAKVMLNKGYVKDYKEVFSKYLSESGLAYVKKTYVNPQDCLDVIKQAGGAACLAHPLLYGLTKDELTCLVEHLKAFGLYGLEAIYPTHTKSQCDSLIKLAYQYGLKITGGSDFHGENRPDIILGRGFGNISVPYSVLETLKLHVF